MKKITTIIFCVLCSSILTFAQNDAVTATEYYNKGVKLFKKSKFLEADSFFTLSLNKHWAVDAFFNRALTRRELGDEQGFCKDLYMATANGDSTARKAFLKKCSANDTSYFDGKIRIIAKHKYDSNKDSIIIDSSGGNFWYNVTDTISPLAREDSPALFKPEVMPVFPGKEEGLVNFLGKNIQYPPNSRDKGIQGTVFVTFIISREGHVEDIKILRSANEELDKEAMRVVSIMPPWFPGMQNGKFVNVQYNLPIRFAVKNH